MKNRKEQINEILKCFHLIRRKISFESQNIPKHIDVTPAQASVLFLVKHNNDMSIRDIAQKLGISRSATTKLVDNLVLKGYLTREENTNDRRIVKIRLSQNGKLHFLTAKKYINLNFSKIFKDLTDEDIKTLQIILSKIQFDILNKTSKENKNVKTN